MDSLVPLKTLDLLARVAVHRCNIHAHTTMQAEPVMWWRAFWVAISDHMAVIFPKDRGWGRAWNNQKHGFDFEFLWTAYSGSIRNHTPHLSLPSLVSAIEKLSSSFSGIQFWILNTKYTRDKERRGNPQSETIWGLCQTGDCSNWWEGNATVTEKRLSGKASWFWITSYFLKGRNRECNKEVFQYFFPFFFFWVGKGLSVTQAVHKLVAIPLPQPPNYRDCRHQSIPTFKTLSMEEIIWEKTDFL